ncbi:unnamed protein product [Protopolystoma xenopodis]|uniref:Uncharacterized protein n=1 Tax=Protopolystoma xenopodis TaxID=117903 RepID=A0A448XQW9_9PLAT|nr:unnamed protein product [Protopolystoma xenopodis]
MVTGVVEVGVSRRGSAGVGWHDNTSVSGHRDPCSKARTPRVWVFWMGTLPINHSFSCSPERFQLHSTFGLSPVFSFSDDHLERDLGTVVRQIENKIEAFERDGDKFAQVSLTNCHV